MWGGLILGNGDDELYIDCGAILIDNIDYDGGPVWPGPTGASMSLDPAWYDTTANDDDNNWCEGSTSYNGDLGSPNMMNPTCP